MWRDSRLLVSTTSCVTDCDTASLSVLITHWTLITWVSEQWRTFISYNSNFLRFLWDQQTCSCCPLLISHPSLFLSLRIFLLFVPLPISYILFHVSSNKTDYYICIIYYISVYITTLWSLQWVCNDDVPKCLWILCIIII